MNKYPVEVGSLVVSRAGRDVGRRFVVIRELDQEFVLTCDGGLRTIDRPKKKRRKHLICKGEYAEAIREKLLSGAGVTDAEIRRSLLSEEA